MIREKLLELNREIQTQSGVECVLKRLVTRLSRGTASFDWMVNRKDDMRLVDTACKVLHRNGYTVRMTTFELTARDSEEQRVLLTFSIRE